MPPNFDPTNEEQCKDDDEVFAAMADIPSITSCHIASQYLTTQGLCSD